MLLGLSLLAGGALTFAWMRPTLIIRSASMGATVFLDGKDVGRISKDGTLRMPGVSRQGHLLRVVSGSSAWESRVAFGPSELRKVVEVKSAPDPAAGARDVPAAEALAAGQPLPANASAEGAGSDLRLWYRDLGTEVGLALRSTANPMLLVDVNQNGVADDDSDISYAAFSGGTCIQYVHAEGTPARCGEVQTGAKAAVRRTDRWEVFWTITKSELGPAGSGALIAVRTFDPTTQKTEHFPGRPFEATWRLRFGAAAAQPPPPPAKVVVFRDAPLPKEPSAVFHADTNRILAGEAARLTWTTSNVVSAQILPSPGVVGLDGEVVVKPPGSVIYRLIVKGADGRLLERTAAVEVIQPLAIDRFATNLERIELDGEFTLMWSVRGATGLNLELTGKPPGSRASLQRALSGAEGQVRLRVDPSEFTRFGLYEYRLVAKGADGSTKEERTRVLLPAK